MDPLETYIRELQEIRASGAGVAELSYYGPLENLLNEIGKTLKPKVRCIMNLKNQGAGFPDAQLGRQVAALLDPENRVPGVISGAIRPELKSIAIISRVGGGTLNPAAGDLAVTVGWGHAGRGGVTMPGKGKVEVRDYMPDELAAIKEGAESLDLAAEQAIQHLGETTCDIYLNEIAYWKNVPAKVWDYRIGGYQIIKKWLSYREQNLLGRSLTTDEAREVMKIARCIAAILLLEPALDANYEAIKESAYVRPGADKL